MGTKDDFFLMRLDPKVPQLDHNQAQSGHKIWNIMEKLSHHASIVHAWIHNYIEIKKARKKEQS